MRVWTKAGIRAARPGGSGRLPCWALRPERVSPGRGPV